MCWAELESFNSSSFNISHPFSLPFSYSSLLWWVSAVTHCHPFPTICHKIRIEALFPNRKDEEEQFFKFHRVSPGRRGHSECTVTRLWILLENVQRKQNNHEKWCKTAGKDVTVSFWKCLISRCVKSAQGCPDNFQRSREEKEKDRDLGWA